MASNYFFRAAFLLKSFGKRSVAKQKQVKNSFSNKLIGGLEKKKHGRNTGF